MRCRDPGVNQDLAYVTSLDQPQVPPSLAPVVGSVDTVPPGRTLSVVLLTCARVHHVGVRRSDRHVSERADPLIREDVAPRMTPVGDLPEPSGRGCDENRGRVVRKRLDVVHASSGYGRSDQAGPEGFELGFGDGGHVTRGRRLGDRRCRVEEETDERKDDQSQSPASLPTERASRTISRTSASMSSTPSIHSR